jgi:hypothetical protein
MRSTVLCALVLAAVVRAASAAPLATTPDDFHLPGTQPLTVMDPFATPDACTLCHSNYAQPALEPYRTWQSSMMAQSGRDPLMWAALAIANQDAAHSGETCLRCHLPKGWLEGRSTPEDGTAMTAGDRQGVQCSVCHRLVDPFGSAGSPAEDGPILSALDAPVPLLGSAMMVADPVDRLRGPFDVAADLGSDPHVPLRSTLVSPFHATSDLCGTCHNVRNPIFTRNPISGEYEPNAVGAAADPAGGFPEQSTYDEWAASTYASGGVLAPQFGRNQPMVSTCQDCHMPAVTGRAANFGVLRDDMPLHELAGANTFIPAVLPSHPTFGAEVDAALLQNGIANATAMLRRAATVSAQLAGGTLTVRVTNESGHKLPTGYPEGRRMWLHVRAYDAHHTVVFESGRYASDTATLLGYGAAPMTPDYDPYLHVWETVQGLSPAWAGQLGVQPGHTFHLALNNARLKDNRIPPRGFTNAAFDAFDGAPVGAAYPDGQYWDDVSYPVGAQAVEAEVTLYYQTASREYVEFLRDTNSTNTSGTVLYDLWHDHDPSTPVEMAHAFVETDAAVVTACRRTIAKETEKFQKIHLREWAQCFAAAAHGRSCNASGRDAHVAAASAALHDKIGGAKDKRCAARNLTPITLGHSAVCPAPCATTVIFDLTDLASCAVCVAAAANDAALAAGYGPTPPVLPAAVPAARAKCQRALGKASALLVVGAPHILDQCAFANLRGRNSPPVDCASDPDGLFAALTAKAAHLVDHCTDFTGLAGCATSGTAPAVKSCIETAIGAAAPAVATIGYP